MAAIQLPRHDLDVAGSTNGRGRVVELWHPPSVRSLPDRATRVRRRRLAALVAATALVMAAVAGGRLVWQVLDPVPAGRPAPLDAPPGEVYVVRPGDTLWTIAGRLAPDEDPRPVVDALRAANGDADLQVGERLVLAVD